MAAPLTSFDSFFDQLGQSPGSGTEYDLSGDTTPTPGASPPVAMPASTSSTPTTSQGQQSAAPAAQPATQAPAAPSSTSPPSSGFATPTGTSAPATPRTSTNIDLASFAAPQAANSFQGSLFSKLGSQIGQARTKLKGAADTFSGQVSPFRQYGADIQNQLEAGIAPGANQGATDTAKGLVNAAYTGPQGLDQATLDELQGAFSTIQPTAASLNSAAGAADLVRGTAPTLSSGERRFEAKHLLKDQGYKQTAAAYGQQANDLLADYYRSQQEAKDIATQRSGEEADIAQKSKDYLGGQQTSESAAIQSRVDAANKQEQALAQAYADWEAHPTEDSLAKLNQLGAGVDSSLLFTEAGKKAQEANTVKQSILSKPEYEKIKDVPLMQLALNKHGRETLQVDPKWWATNAAGMSKAQKKEISNLATQRQIELERAGFSPGSAAQLTPTNTGPEAERIALSKNQGQYALYDPLYFGGGQPDFAAADPTSYLGFQDAVQASRENQATPDEIARYNAISGLLGNPDQITGGVPYQAASITNDAQRYKEEQDADIQARQEALTKGLKGEYGQTKKARKQVRSQALASALGKALGSKTLGSTFAGILHGDPKAVANLPFALAAAPVDTAQHVTGQGNGELSQKASLVKAPRQVTGVTDKGDLTDEKEIR